MGKNLPAAQPAVVAQPAAIEGMGFWLPGAEAQYDGQAVPPIIAPVEVNAQQVIARPKRTFRWGYFGARAYPQYSGHRGYFGDHCDWVLRRGY